MLKYHSSYASKKKCNTRDFQYQKLLLIIVTTKLALKQANWQHCSQQFTVATIDSYPPVETCTPFSKVSRKTVAHRQRVQLAIVDITTPEHAQRSGTTSILIIPIKIQEFHAIRLEAIVGSMYTRWLSIGCAILGII